jgi:hypothetical protein
LLIENKEDVKVVQELMRHSNPNTTLRLYAQASSERLRDAQSRIIEMVHNAPLPCQRMHQLSRKLLLCTNVPRGKPAFRRN